MKATRQQVIAFRVAAQGLHRLATSPASLAVLDLGVQASSAHGPRLAFDARLADSAAPVSVGPGHRLALVWSLRGAPHIHRRADLDELAAALWPLSEADAAGRMNQTGARLARAGVQAMPAFADSVTALRSVVTKPTPKGAVSTAVTPLIAAPLRLNCRACQAVHVSDSVLRAASLPAGMELEPETAPPVLRRRDKARWPVASSPAALHRLVLAYLSLLGPAGPGEVADYLGARRADISARWPADLVEVTVEGATAWLPEPAAAALGAAQPAEMVRLLGPFDPYLQARDRDLIVPDRAAHKALWPVLGRPGVLFVDGEVVGSWRPQATARLLTLAVEAFAPLPASTWSLIEDEAARVAAVRGAAEVRVTRP